MSEDWDVDSHKTEYENEEHWELRRNFMLAHKDKFPEDELVCLAQVFTNIEFLGCRYPDKTMIRVAELAKGVVESFREQRKDSLKRTFVAASDAASAKVKGQHSVKNDPNIKKQKHNKRTESPVKIMKYNEDNLNNSKCSEKNNENNNNDSLRSKYGGVKTFEIEQSEEVVEQEMNESESEKPSEMDSLETVGELGNFVLVLSEEEQHPINVIQMNASLNKCALRWDVQHGIKTCKLYLNDQCVGIGSGKSAKACKEEAAKVAIAKLRESYYGIRMRAQSPEPITVDPSELGTSSETTCTQLGENNVGMKLMKLMGWQGGGLGSKEQGRKDPVSATLHVHRKGLGLKKNSTNVKEFRRHAKEYIQAWAKSNSQQKLVFSTGFTSEERKFMHHIAKSLSLKSKSYGKDDKRHLVISRRPNPLKILEELLKHGGNTEKYELLIPTKAV